MIETPLDVMSEQVFGFAPRICPRTLENTFLEPLDASERDMVRRTQLCIQRRIIGQEPLFGCRDCPL